MERQTLIAKQERAMETQDKMLGYIAVDVSNLYDIAIEQHKELEKQEGDIEDLSKNISDTTTKIGNARVKIKRTIEAVSNGKSMCCIMVLILLIIGLVIIIAMGL